MLQIAEGIQWAHLYYVKGEVPKHYRLRNAIKDPPCSGWQHAVIIEGEKRSTIFCPYTLQAYHVKNGCLELDGAEEPKKAYSDEFLRDLLNKKWNEYQGLGYMRDYDTCALLMKKMGWKVPAQVLTGGGEDTRKKGGKEVGSKLLKPVKASSKRGKFLQWFMDGDNSRSVREAMAEFGMTRSNALSYLFMLQKDHGIGYELVGDTATIMMPDGCDDPFDEQPKPKATEKPDDDSWLDGEPIEEDDNDDWLN